MRRTNLPLRSLVTLLLTVAASQAGAQSTGPSRSVRLDVTRDTWVSEVGREADGNNGAASRLKFKSIQEMTLLDVDAAPLRGRTIRSAALHLQKAGDERLWRVTVSSVGAEWFEGTGSSYAVQPGGATFRHRRHPDLAWSIGGGDLCHVILGNGGTTWRMADASPPDRDGWQTVPVDPKVIAARVAGLSYGFLVFDDTGSEWTRRGESFTFRLFPNRFAYSRDQNRASAPYFDVELGPEDRRPPAAPTGLRVEPRTASLAGRRGPGLVGDAPRRRPGRHARVLRGARRPRLAARADPDGRRGRRTGRDAPARPEAARRRDGRALGAGRGRGRQPRPGGDGEHPALRPASPRRCPSRRRRRARPSAATTTLPRLGSIEVAILDELDKVHPVTGELIPAAAGGLPGRQSPLECRRRDGSRSRRRGTSSSPSRSCCAAAMPPIGTRSGPS